MDKVHEYPSCDALLLNIALALESFVSMFASDRENTAQKDAKNTIAALKQLIPALRRRWDPSASMLYRHIPDKKGDEHLSEMLQNNILNELKNPENHEYDFLREEPDFKDFLHQHL